MSATNARLSPTSETQSPIQLLLVEDDPMLRDLIRLVLEQQGLFDVATAQNGIEALEKFQEQPPDVLLLDILLPKMNGLELLRRLQSEQRLGKTRVFVLSGLGYQEIIQQALAAGAGEFLVKPFDVGLLMERLNRFLSKPLLSTTPAES
jgi:CheY-like chemotaxis protein